jgi:hypothetical protein
MIKTQKQHEGNWITWNTVTHKTAEIIRIEDTFFGMKKPNRYRVDVSGKTVASMIDTYTEAKKISRNQVK